MADDAPITETPAAAVVAAPPWHAGFDADTLAYVQAKKLDGMPNINEAFAHVAKFHRDAEAYIGIPADQRIRTPNPNDPASVKAFWNKFGTPENAEGYDLSGVKSAAGQDIDPGLATALRNTLYEHNIPASAAPKVAEAFVKHMDATEAAQMTATEGQLAAQQAALKLLWGPNYDANINLADQAAKRIGLDVQGAALLAEKVGADKVLEVLRKIGANTSEDSFVAGNPMQGATPPMTVVEARETLTVLQGDREFGKRLIDGDLAAKKQWDAAFAAAHPDLIAAAA